MTSAAPKFGSKIEETPLERAAQGRFAPVRREERVVAIRSAEYTPFPRTHASETPRRGFTRDASPLGMCLGVDLPEPVGALLRIEVRELDGRPIGATVGRVVWCRATRDGRYWIGLDLLCEVDGIRSKWHRQMLGGRD